MNIQPPPINRLIIVGNGFDIANNLPTRYTDFMTYFLYTKFLKVKEMGFYEDEYLIILHLTKSSSFTLSSELKLNDYLKLKSKKRYQIDRSSPLIDSIEYIQSQEPQLSDFYFHVKDKFLNQLFDVAKDFNWVDIETEYYKALIELTINKDHVMGFINNYSVEKLHNTFQMIKDEFVKYLCSFNYEKFNNAVAEIFDFPINCDFKQRRKQRDFSPNRPGITKILNCNYTPTISHYKLRANWQDEFQIINIHGQINNAENPIIFGYGDETISSYKKLEELNNDECLRFMKNKDYALTTNYSNLISFIEDVPFEVYILGHSCGLSDRVMLNTIFEHEMCKSIYIFYHQNGDKDNFIETYHSISRQFSMQKRADLRKKVITKINSMPFPQMPK